MQKRVNEDGGAKVFYIKKNSLGAYEAINKIYKILYYHCHYSISVNNYINSKKSSSKATTTAQTFGYLFHSHGNLT